MPVPDVTVVIPNWNGREHLGECLTSLARAVRVGDDTEVIVVDNGSTDGSAHLVRERFPRVRLLTNDTNRGFAAACNDGARASSAPRVAFLNNDARVEPGWLTSLTAFLDSHADAAAVGSLVLDWGGTRIDFGRAGLSPLARGIQLDFGEPVANAPTRPTEQLFANGAAMLVRRDIFLEVGGFDERFFAYYEDVDLGWRLWILGWRVFLEPSSVVFHRHHGTSRRLRADQIAFLFARNAIASAIKNVDDQTFGRFVPILLLSEAARTAADLGSLDRFHAPGFKPFAYRRDEKTSLPTRVRRVAGSEVLRVLRHNTALRSRLARLVVRVVDPGATLVDARSSAAVAALDEILWGWPELTASRAAIQAKRRRSDQEISRLFGLDGQRRIGRAEVIRPDETRAAIFRALDAAGLEWLLPRG